LLLKIGVPTPRPVWLANPDGLIELALKQVGIHDVNVWLQGPSLALFSIMALNVWTTTGTMMVIFLAGLQNIPGDVYEAAALDGATRGRMFRDITVPLLKPVISFVVTIGLIGTFQVFDQIWVMSNGGPFRTTTTLAFLVYLEGFQQGRGLGYASALAIVLFLIILVLYLIQRRLTESDNMQ
jgi:multiple sugar transport system permease protein